MGNNEKKQNNFDLHFKAKLIEEYERLPDHPPFDVFGERYGLKKGIFNKWWRVKDAIKEQTSKAGGNCSVKKIRRGGYDLLDDVIVEWLKESSSTGSNLSRDTVREKAVQVWKCLKEKRYISEEDEGRRAFKASDGWLNNLKRRRGIDDTYFLGPCHPSLIHLSKQEDELKNKLPYYHPENVYCIMESNLFYKMIPDRSVCDDYLHGMFQFKDKVSFLVSVNGTGTDRRKLLVVSSVASPPSLQRINFQNLRVEFLHHPRAIVDGDTLKAWLLNLNSEMSSMNKHILLLFQNSKHETLLSDLTPLSNVDVVFLSRNEFLKNQKSNTIVNALKAQYRTRLMQRLIKINNSGLHASNPNLRECLEMLTDGWLGSIDGSGSCVNNFTIQSYWLNARLLNLDQLNALIRINGGNPCPGYCHDLQKALHDLNGIVTAPDKLLTALEFVEIEDNLSSSQCVSVEELINKVLLNNNPNSRAVEVNECDGNEEEVTASPYQALAAMDLLLDYLPQLPFYAIDYMKNLKGLKSQIEEFLCVNDQLSLDPSAADVANSLVSEGE